MIAWRDARADADWGLAEYASEWIGAAVESVSEQQRNKPILAGHSIGGTFVALFAAAQPDRVAKLLLIEAPLYFGEEAGALAPIVAGSPPGDVIAQFAGGGPGSLLDVASVAADPGEFVIGRWQDAVACALDPEGWAIHQRVIRWTLDEFAQPSRLFAETVELLYRRNAFARGELRLSGRAVLPQNLSQLAVASVIDVSSRLVPPVSALAPIEQAAVYEYEPERGVALQHVGPLVGRRAHGVLWPRLLEWLVAAVQPGYLE
jgi:polyhydroxyalkanoate synthase